MEHIRKRKNWPLLLGFAIIWIGYFSVRGVQFLTKETAHGKIIAAYFKNFSEPGSPRGSRGDFHGWYAAPVIQFTYKNPNVDSVEHIVVQPQAMSSDLYKEGESIDVIFPKGHPQQAEIYSLLEFWLTAPYIIILIMVCILWLIIYAFVVFKPWER
jgi:hypothetical protein